MKCPECRNVISNNSISCPYCSHRIIAIRDYDNRVTYDLYGNERTYGVYGDENTRYVNTFYNDALSSINVDDYNEISDYATNGNMLLLLAGGNIILILIFLNLLLLFSGG